ncbi:MAG: hypothetical protein Q9M22_04215 [Mariprofundaceae bacterium]|nr:hypothetical protein [Mariprofundaceae bacterium]
MNIGLSLFPNIISVDTELVNKRDSNNTLQLSFVFVHKKEEGVAVVEKFIKKVKTIRKNPIKAQLIALNDLITTSPADIKQQHVIAIFITEELVDSALDRLLVFSVKNHILVFSPFEHDISRGVTVGIFVGSKILPYINMTNVKRSGIKFYPLFLKLARIYE